MAVRYVEIGQYPDVRREVRGKLSEILVATANPGTYAAPEDVTGCFLEMGADGLWTGASVGTMPKATADALYASGVLDSVKVGTPVTVNGQQVTWVGAGWNIVADGSVTSWGLSKFKSVSGRPARIAIDGDSTTAGYGAGTGGGGALIGARELSYPVQMGRLLGWQTGSYFGDQNTQPALGANSYGTYDPRVTLGSWTQGGVGVPKLTCFGGGIFYAASTTTVPSTFTPEQPFDTYKVWFCGASGLGSIVVSLDGVPVQTISAARGSDTLLSASFTCPLGSHVISVGTIGKGYHLGTETYNSQSNAPMLMQGGYCSATLAMKNLSAYPWQPLSGLVAMGPDLVLLNCTINDVVAGTELATVATNLDAINIAHAAVADVVNVVSFAPNVVGSTNGYLNDFGTMLKLNASAFHGAYADFRFISGQSAAITNAFGWLRDAYHLKANGYLEMAKFFSRLFR